MGEVVVDEFNPSEVFDELFEGFDSVLECRAGDAAVGHGLFVGFERPTIEVVGGCGVVLSGPVGEGFESVGVGGDATRAEGRDFGLDVAFCGSVELEFVWSTAISNWVLGDRAHDCTSRGASGHFCK